MFKRMLDGRSVRLPFLGVITTAVAQSDWKRDAGLPGQSDRPFFTAYRGEGSSGTMYQAGWLEVIWEPKASQAREAAVKAVGWMFASRMVIAKLGLLFTLGT